jgi:hypothetical protein
MTKEILDATLRRHDDLFLSRLQGAPTHSLRLCALCVVSRGVEKRLGISMTTSSG